MGHGNRGRGIAAAAVAYMVAAASPAQASLLQAQDLMQGFTTITLEDHTANQETEGTMFVGGDYIGGHNVNPDDLPDVNLLGMYSGAFFVGGDVRISSGTARVQKGDDVWIGGTVASGTLNISSGDTNVHLGSAPTGTGQVRYEGTGSGTITTGFSGLPVAEVGAILRSASLELAGLAPTGGTAYLSDQNNRRFESVADENGLAVFNIASGDFLSSGTFNGVSADPGVTTVINVGGEHITIEMNANLVNANVVFNFYEAITVDINRTFNYSVLAPLAAVDVDGSGMFASVVAKSLVQSSEIRPYDGGTNFDGNFAPPPDTTPIPLPGALGMLALGLGGLGGLRAWGRRAA